MKDILSMTLDELTADLTNEKPYRAKQIYSWLHQKRAVTFDEMSDLPAALREKLNKEHIICRLTAVKTLVSERDGTKKYLFELPDGECIETVFMEYKHAHSLCISSQVGCRMGCKFCASGLDGLVRNLTPAEMLSQVYEVERLTGETIGSLVMMGIGEPLDNYDNTIKFLTLLSDKNGKNLSLRHVSLSTCGLVPKIRELSKLHLGLTLSVSLHDSDNAKREDIMPVTKAYNIDELIKACKEYIAETGRRISFEYAVIAGVNDSKTDAERLIKLLRGINCHVNLIPVNNVSETDFHNKKDNVKNFEGYLNAGKIPVTVRRTLGSDINAACGQLRKQRTEDRRQKTEDRRQKTEFGINDC
ncbi:MAG: 23S rRNA (adenine(2503)-C(2))-methyltransferase RlmN [Ruminococcus sp.]|jgi:23S rRNA (adenine2503-C2)-methyltransferase|nr:23S rRNA (adenine(2503)-C(2))-methyltransferase RlmN [Ruminococcus sp.]